METPLQTVYPAFLATNQRVHDLYARELGQLMSLTHWAIAFKTGLPQGVLTLLLTFTPAARWFRESLWQRAARRLPDRNWRCLLSLSHYRFHALEHIRDGGNVRPVCARCVVPARGPRASHPHGVVAFVRIVQSRLHSHSSVGRPFVFVLVFLHRPRKPHPPSAQNPLFAFFYSCYCESKFARLCKFTFHASAAEAHQGRPNAAVPGNTSQRVIPTKEKAR